MKIFTVKLKLQVAAGEDQSEIDVEAMVENAVVGSQLIVLAVVALGIGLLVLRVALSNELYALEPCF